MDITEQSQMELMATRREKLKEWFADVAKEGEKPAIAVDAWQGGFWAESCAKT
ncbi:MAG: hypothetical protein ACYCWB_05385 [Thiobacillus sp.]